MAGYDKGDDGHGKDLGPDENAHETEDERAELCLFFIRALNLASNCQCLNVFIAIVIILID